MKAHELSAKDARRIAVRAQLLDKDRPSDLLEVVRHLAMLTVNPTATVAPSADLVLWTRLGLSYDPAELEEALEMRVLIELRGTIRPCADLALYRADMAEWPGRGQLREWQDSNREWIEANDYCRRDILERLRCDGPLPLSELPDTCDVQWSSSGWNDNQNVNQLLKLMVSRGEVASAGRDGRVRLWDLASRVYPEDPIVPSEEARRIRDERRLHALGIARAKAAEAPIEPVDVGEAGEPAVVDGVRGNWRVDPRYLGQPFSGRAALLSPYDRLVQERKRTSELFDFTFELGMYKPVAKRRWGYFPLPILYGDQLVGKLDVTADRKGGVLRVDALHWDVKTTKAMLTAVDREISDLATWLDLERT